MKAITAPIETQPTAAQDFLLEIGTEEMPSAPLINAAKQLPKLAKQALDTAGLAHGAMRVISSPRRLAIIVDAVASKTDEIHSSKRGPAASIAFDDNGAPTRAAEGFARKCGLDASRLVRKTDSDGREYVFAEVFVASRDALPILSALSHDLIASIEWPNYRSQRWGSATETFVRPIRWICALFGTTPVEVRYADVISAPTTRGHRVLSNGVYEVSSPVVYESVLKQAHVLSAEARREAIRAQIAEIEQTRPGARVDTPAKIFDEVVNLCEWPTVMVGTFDEEFLAVPHEIICESMLSNQRYFPTYDKDGKLTREFVIVSNGDPACEKTIVNGNERVVRARLEDAKFFYESDMKVPLDEFVQRLDRVVFQKKLGTMLQKVTRIEALVGAAATQLELDGAQTKLALRAAHLAKADLVSQAVVEFTSQQGVMGGYYAGAQGEDSEVSAAIAQHYRPRFAGDAIPANLYGQLVALADKLDTIVSLFAVGEPPTGSSDPFAQRRAALGCIAILRELPKLDAAALIDAGLDALAQQGIAFELGRARDEVRTEIAQFIAGRLATIAKDEGAAPDTVEAVSATGVINPSEFLARTQALDEARNYQPELFFDLAAAYTRADHLADANLGLDVDTSLLTEPEQALLDRMLAVDTQVHESLVAYNYAASIHALAQLKEPIDRFFDEIMVMDPDDKIRTNRLRLLNRFCSIFSDVAHIGALDRKNKR